jgi:hypothetical protein
LGYARADQQRYKAEELLAAGAILLGRVTDEIVAARFAAAPKEEGFAGQMNALPKDVVSQSLGRASWQNTSIIRDIPPRRSPS